MNNNTIVGDGTSADALVVLLGNSGRKVSILITWPIR